MTDKDGMQVIPEEEKRLERQLCFAVYATHMRSPGRTSLSSTASG
jgi:hypothetical protein